MNTGRTDKQTTCLCRDTGGEGTLRAQRTGFNILDNWGHKTPTQSKRKRNRKERIKGSWPETCIQYTQLHVYIYIYIYIYIVNSHKREPNFILDWNIWPFILKLAQHTNTQIYSLHASLRVSCQNLKQNEIQSRINRHRS